MRRRGPPTCTGFAPLRRAGIPAASGDADAAIRRSSSSTGCTPNAGNRARGRPDLRDVAFHEDRSRVHVRRLPRNLACLSNAAISIVRMRGHFRYQPQAQRHYAARHGDALREVLDPAA